ncbi:MAG: metallophosphoesterase [Rhodospirillales bacterium]|jgi:3',5'-cyclic AMP phosphodiesterase CpdA|nr:metallophosphoesterase [Rhodospirillales bacterium]
MKTSTGSRAAVTAALVTLFATASLSEAHARCVNPLPLKFKNGEFRIVQFTDTQDDQNIEPRTVQLMIAAVEYHKPDLVVFSGDNITGGPKNNADVRKAIDNIAKPLEERGIPFMMVFGNHDQDSFDGRNVTWSEHEQYEYYRSFTCNVNPSTAEGVTGHSNFVRLVFGSVVDFKKPVFAVWGLDSGRYAPNPDDVAGQKINGNENTWDYIRQDQVDWYRNTSLNFEKRFGKKIPGLMWFHIPLFEHATMWNTQFGTPWPNDTDGTANPVIPSFTSQDPTNTDYDRYGMRANSGYGQNERNECVCTGPFNSGLYAAVRDRGDVKGIFVGHDHINSYFGNYHGVYLGYAANTGFGTYGLGGTDNHRLRGARLFTIQENDPEVFETEMKFAGADFGICIEANIANCPSASSMVVKAGSDEPAMTTFSVNGSTPPVEMKNGRAVGYIVGN